MTVTLEPQLFALAQPVSGMTETQQSTFIQAVNLHGYHLHEKLLKRTVKAIEVMETHRDWKSGDLEIRLDLRHMGDAALFELRVRWHRRTVFDVTLLAKQPRPEGQVIAPTAYTAHVRTFESGAWQRQIAAAYAAKLN